MQKYILSLDAGTTSCTMIYHIHTLKWDGELHEVFDIPAAILPVVKPSSEFYGQTSMDLLCGEIPMFKI